MKKWLQNKLIKWTGADKSNRFKKWKLAQPIWIQFLIELIFYLFIFWLLNLIFNPLGYKITPW
tara:strand:+ start:219 stop:407 length:189 start_codon:yes stop_codon:yes gene_type:complete